MGSIRTDVWEKHLNDHPDEEEILKPFLHGFFITWGRIRRAYNTQLSVYFMNPEHFIAEAFGFDQEVMLVYSKYDRLEPRSVQAAEAFMSDDPARGRVEKLTLFFVSEARDTEEWFHSYTSMHQESRIIIPLNAGELRTKNSDPWYIRNKTSTLLYGRDLFDYRLPLEKDTYFFGRSDLAVNLFDAIKNAENRGIFGLRKTGKTSLLFKLERMIKSDNIAHVLYFDCKLPSIRKLRWYELLGKICSSIATSCSLEDTGCYSEVEAADNFINLIGQLSKPILLVFDEIEYVSPIAIDDVHWHKDFIDFWQTFWACQSRHRKVSALIAGVNPYVVEIDNISGIQNPLFGIVSYQFLIGLTNDETRNMIRTLGKRMGLKFAYEAANYIHDRYGGHPLLTRMACSTINNIIKKNSETRPVNLLLDRMKKEEEDRDSELIFYCRHVVSELKQFYPDEYEMLELLSSGQVNDFVELAAYPEYTKHLRSYGLLSKDSFNRPSVAIPVINRYIGMELARKEGRQTLYKIVAPSERETWLIKRKKSIVDDFRLLERAIKQSSAPIVFGPNSFPLADEFVSTTVVATKKEFENFISTCNKCFVESIENYGQSIRHRDYYWNTIKNSYPGLWSALQRIKIYRHDNVHLILTRSASSDLLEYLNQDLEGRKPSSVKDIFFVLQQCVLDGLLTGIQIELSNLT